MDKLSRKKWVIIVKCMHMDNTLDKMLLGKHDVIVSFSS